MATRSHTPGHLAVPESLRPTAPGPALAAAAARSRAIANGATRVRASERTDAIVLPLSPRQVRRSGDAIRIVDIINLSTSANTLLRDRVLAMRSRGYDNRILCIDGPCVPRLRAAGIPVTAVHLPRGLDPVALVRSFVEIVTYLRRERIQLVHTHCSIPGAVGRLAARVAGVPIVMHTVHGFSFHEHSPRLERLFYLNLERIAARVTDWLFTQNRFDFEQAARYRLVSRDRLQWVGNGVDVDRFRPRTGERPAGQPVTITCVARMEAVKNHRLLLEAVRMLRARGEAVRVLLVGDGGLRAQLELLCAQWSIADIVEFVGYREDVSELLAETDIAVLTSLKEGIPRAVLEPMAMGLPVVATRVTGTREVVEDGCTGLLVDPTDGHGLADALQQLIRDPGLRARMGAEGRKRALAEFDEMSVVDRIEHVYRRLLTAHGHGQLIEECS